MAIEHSDASEVVPLPATKGGIDLGVPFELNVTGDKIPPVVWPSVSAGTMILGVSPRVIDVTPADAGLLRLFQ
ncbi:MAG: hypothetical protein WCO69_02280 [Candidatus Omnitrophota bacterium]